MGALRIRSWPPARAISDISHSAAVFGLFYGKFSLRTKRAGFYLGYVRGFSGYLVDRGVLYFIWFEGQIWRKVLVR